MTVIALAELAFIALLVALLIVERREADRHLTERDRMLAEHLKDSARERDLLAERIQRPESRPVPLPEGDVIPLESRKPKDLGELAKIGTVAHRAPTER